MPEVKLNEAQRAAVEYDSGPLMVLAGAGSGKTRVLTARIAHLAHHRGIRPDRIMAVTFTNRAADQMKQRVAELLGREPAGLWIGTFHSLCARLPRSITRWVRHCRRPTPWTSTTSSFIR